MGVKKKISYKQGDWFAVPLESGGFAAGMIARRKRSIIVGYFFGWKWQTPPTLAEVERLRPKDAILVAQCGDLGLHRGTWPVIGSSSYDTAGWPLPQFVRHDSVSGKLSLITYADDDPSREISSTQVTEERSRSFPEDGVFGYAAIEAKLDDLLKNSALLSTRSSNGHTRSGNEAANPDENSRTDEEQAVLVHLAGQSSRSGTIYDPSVLAPLEDALMAAITKQGVGEFDGNEIGLNEATLFMYGPDADALFSAIESTLRSSDLVRGARVVVRYGGPGATERQVKL